MAVRTHHLCRDAPWRVSTMVPNVLIDVSIAIPGQVGTILMDFEGRAYLVDFADAHGKTYAMETIPGERLMLLVYEPLLAVA
ncbi:MAG: DUF4926 domain-containing protein [Coleofasciculus chthonoplastes F3-SA18-01]|uniref:DUF4926 domain-containing protein n=1 Tax=Coleofasciculus chthonoplastes TaxID=64178 RepID=UPI0032FC4119